MLPLFAAACYVERRVTLARFKAEARKGKFMGTFARELVSRSPLDIQPLLHPAVAASLKTFVLQSVPTLKQAFETYTALRQKNRWADSIQIEPIERHRTEVRASSPWSGYRFNSISGEFLGSVEFAVLWGGGFIFYKRTVTTNQTITEKYDSSGLLTESITSSGEIKKPETGVLDLATLTMDPACPIFDHLYHYLEHEYEQAQYGWAKTDQAHLIELYLRETAALQKGFLSFEKKSEDPAIIAIHKLILDVENRSTLTWNERQMSIKSLITDRQKIVSIKCRAHAKNPALFSLGVSVKSESSMIYRMKIRKGSNAGGMLYRYTLGLAFAAIKTIRGNIGYSIALALYGPFTFYFITQPLNPHAMWAVGKVRSAYLDTVQTANAVVHDLAGKNGSTPTQSTVKKESGTIK